MYENFNKSQPNKNHTEELERTISKTATTQPATRANYSFCLKCLASVALLSVGAALLVVGVLSMQYKLIGAGAGLAATGAGLLTYSLFSRKSSKKPEQPEEPTPKPSVPGG